MDFIYGLGGVAKTEGDLKVEFRNERGKIEFTPAALGVEERVSLTHTIFGEAFEYLQSPTSPQTTPKLTIPSPSMVHTTAVAAPP